MNGTLLFLDGFGGFELLIFLFILGIPVILWLWALIDCLKSNFNNNNKLVWVILIILVPFLGAILYLAIGRSQKVTI
jgi:hypothetical protein